MDNNCGFSTDSIENKSLRVEYLTFAGPRIIGFHFRGHNLLAQTPDIKWETPGGVFRLWGGHRLWIAPETLSTTYIPDNAPPQIVKIGGTTCSNNRGKTTLPKYPKNDGYSY
jgi:hypothetical protein